jgi:hypothetical protein
MGRLGMNIREVFFKELYQKIQASVGPLLMGGDFNIIRYSHEKSTCTGHTVWMDMFNSFINDTTLIELVRGGSRFTQTNKQTNPVRSNLDMILVNKEWGQQYPKVRVLTLTRVGSCRCFLHQQITGSIRSCDSSSELVSQTTNTQRVNPGPGPFVEIVALHPVGWY